MGMVLMLSCAKLTEQGKWLGFYFEPCWMASKTPAIPAASLQLKPDLWPPLRVGFRAESSEVDQVEM